VVSQVVQGRTEDPDATREALDRWVRTNDSHGWVRATAGVATDGAFLAVLLFDENVDRPDLAELVDTLVDPTLRTGVRTETFSPGDLARARFVQVVQGAVTDLDEAFRGLTVFQELLAIHAPYLLGTITIAHEGGRFTRVLHFSSEAEARRGEAARPPEVQRSDDELLRLLVGPVEFLDLRDPWLHVATTAASG
jgi:hypothetical protein